MSIIDELPPDKFKDIINNSNSFAEVFRKLNMRYSGYQLKKMRIRIISLNIDISHFKNLYKINKEKRPINYYLTDKLKNTSTNSLKIRLINENILKYECNICKNNGMWQNNKLSLHLDHINGDRYDNRLENLRLLCPNCHSQTETYSGKNCKNQKSYLCPMCYGPKIMKKSKYCRSCFLKLRIKQRSLAFLTLPEKDILQKLVWEKTTSILAKEFNVSENGFRNFCKKNDIQLPKNNYWLLRNNGYTHEEAINYKKRIRNQHKLFHRNQLIEIKNLLKNSNLSYRKIAKMFNTSHQTISEIDRGISYVSDKILKLVNKYSENDIVPVGTAPTS